MDNFLYKAIKKYWKTLTTIGYISTEDEKKLFMANALYGFYKSFYNYITKKDIIDINNYFQCLVENNCLFESSVPYLDYNNRVEHSLITIIDSDIITTESGTTVTSTQNITQKFTDFEIRTEVQADQYVVGYDQSDKKEVSINVQDLGVFWE